MKLEKFFLGKNIVAVLCFRTGLHTFPSSKYKTSTLSEFTEAYSIQILCLYASD